MLPLSLVLIYVLAASAANVSIASDTFVSSDGGVTFSLNIPTDSDDLYFVLSGPISNEWIAVGLGNNHMAGALILLAYGSANGSGATLSPRLVSGHVEPVYEPSIDVELLPGTGIAGNNLVINGRCSNCRSWPGGSLDVQSTAQNMIYAVGRSSGVICSDSVTADTRRHTTYGVFTMDLTQASSPGGLPYPKTTNINAVQASMVSDKDIAPAAHASLMVLAFLGFMPFGLIILRLLKFKRLHGLNQFFAILIALVGFGLGIYCSTMYNRSKRFNSAHQIFGLIIMVSLLATFVLGYTDHRIQKRTQSPTRMGPIHLWLGRIVIPAGVINGFLGFPLALNANYNYALAALAVLVGIPVVSLVVWKAVRRSKKEKPDNNVNLESFSPGQFAPNSWNQPHSGLDDQPNLPSASYLPSYGKWPQRGV